MKHKFFLTVLILGIAFAGSLKAQLIGKEYNDPNIKEIVAGHSKIAILPLKVVMTDSRPNAKKRATEEELQRKADEYQLAFQNSMYSWFLRRKKRGRMEGVDIQDVNKTNTLLKRSGIVHSDDLVNFTKDEICEILGVDAVFGGNVNTSATFSRGGATALAVFTGISVRTGDADVFIRLWDKMDGKMIWSFDRTVSSNYTNSTDDVVDYLMKRVSKRFPYERN